MQADTVTPKKQRVSTAKHHVSNITPELKNAVKKNDANAYIQLGNLVKEELIYKKNNSSFFSFPLDELTKDITDRLYTDIYNGKFDDKDISLDIACVNGLYEFIAGLYNVKKDTFHRMKRIMEMSEKHKISIITGNAYKFVKLSEYDGYSVGIGMTEVYKCITIINQFMHRTPYNDTKHYSDKPGHKTRRGPADY